MKETPVRVLIVGQQEACVPLSQLLRGEGMQVQEAEDSRGLLNFVRFQAPDVVLLNVELPKEDGLEILRRVHALDGHVMVVFLTSRADLREAIAAVKAGAYDYLPGPVNGGELVSAIRDACTKRRQQQARPADEETEKKRPLAELMGGSEKVRLLAADVARVAPTNFSVLISGETGAGKELVARAIHEQSHRAANLFLAVDCGAIPETLIENELFGHERGSYTGADRTEIGKFEAASGGTLFLDEIANLPVGMQARLLRVLQEKRLYRIGGTAKVKADVRVLTATNQDLRALVQSQTFRGDLFHRLSQYSLTVPPLRERREDIVFLAHRFLHETNRELDKQVLGFSERALGVMLGCDWPGNVRELRNVIGGAVLLAEETIGLEHLHLRAAPGASLPAENNAGGDGSLSLREIVQRSVIQIERTLLVEMLQRTGGNKAKAARMLGIDYKTIHTKIRLYGMKGEAI